MPEIPDDLIDGKDVAKFVMNQAKNLIQAQQAQTITGMNNLLSQKLRLFGDMMEIMHRNNENYPMLQKAWEESNRTGMSLRDSFEILQARQMAEKYTKQQKKLQDNERNNRNRAQKARQQSQTPSNRPLQRRDRKITPEQALREMKQEGLLR
jgi:hypothetical protein